MQADVALECALAQFVVGGDGRDRASHCSRFDRGALNVLTDSAPHPPEHVGSVPHGRAASLDAGQIVRRKMRILRIRIILRILRIRRKMIFRIAAATP